MVLVDDLVVMSDFFFKVVTSDCLSGYEWML